MPPHVLRSVLSSHLGRLKGSDLETFLRVARRYVARRPKLLYEILDNLRFSLTPPIFDEYAALVSLLDARTKQGVKQIREAATSIIYPLSKPGANKYAPLFTPLMIRWTQVRHASASDAKYLKRHLARLSPRDQQRCVRTLFTILRSTTQTRPGEPYDMQLLNLIIDMVKKRPALAYVSDLRYLNADLKHRYGENFKIFEALLELGTALGKRFPKALPRIRRAVLKYRKHADRVNERVIRDWNKLADK
jgi:hypothetical protein